MDDFAHEYWWLVFPMMWFVFGMFGMWMSNRRHRDQMELMKTYAAQGKDPAELAKALNGDPQAWGGYPGLYGNRWAWRAARRGPYWEWRRAIMFGCLAIGFWLASYYADFPGSERAFTIVAIVMSVLAAASIMMAIMTTAMGPRPPHE